MNGVVRICGLQPQTIIGCYDWERTVKQRLEVDLELTADFGLAAHTDDLCHALDYAAISEHLMSFVSASQFELLEALSKAIIDEIFDRWPVSEVTVHIRKPGAVPAASCVGVSLTRARSL